MQWFFYTKKAESFTLRPRMEKKYVEEVKYLIDHSEVVLDLPLPSYINQEFRISDFAPVVKDNNLPKFIKPEGEFCTREFRDSLRDKKIWSFYREQSRDEKVKRKLDTVALVKCGR